MINNRVVILQYQDEITMRSWQYAEGYVERQVVCFYTNLAPGTDSRAFLAALSTTEDIRRRPVWDGLQLPSQGSGLYTV